MADEYIERDRPARLFYDMDAAGATPEEMVLMKEEVVVNTRHLLMELFQLEDVALIELDGSRPTKQSRHLIFQVVFATVAEMGVFVTKVLERCTMFVKRHGKCAVDMIPYTHSSVFMRLCYSRKFSEPNYRLWPTEPVQFEKTLIAHPPTADGPLLNMAMESLPMPMRSLAPSELPDEWKRTILRYFKRFTPEQVTASGRHFSFSLQGIYCPYRGRAHTNNKTFVNIYSPDPYTVIGTFRCPASSCSKTAWDCGVDFELLLNLTFNNI